MSADLLRIELTAEPQVSSQQVQIIYILNAVAESATADKTFQMTKEAFAAIHFRDERNEQLRQREEDTQRRCAEEATRLRNQLAVATQEGHR